MLVNALLSRHIAFVAAFLGSDASVEVDFLGNKNVVYKCPLSMYKITVVFS